MQVSPPNYLCLNTKHDYIDPSLANEQQQFVSTHNFNSGSVPWLLGVRNSGITISYNPNDCRFSVDVQPKFTMDGGVYVSRRFDEQATFHKADNGSVIPISDIHKGCNSWRPPRIENGFGDRFGNADLYCD